MTETVQMPALDRQASLPPKQWMVMDVRGTGMGQVFTGIDSDEPLVDEDTYATFHRFSVAEGERINPGHIVAEVLVDNIVFNVTSLSHGVVSGLVPYDENDIIKPGDVLLHVASTNDHSVRKTGLTPKPSTYQRWLRFGR